MIGRMRKDGIGKDGIGKGGIGIGRMGRLRVAIIGMVTIVSGCSSMGVEPWERDLLAKQAMAINSSPMDQAIDDHIYFSKEASSGGKSFAGGGCGCN